MSERVAGIDRGTAQWYVDTALARLLAKADELVEAGGDELLSRRPEVEGANSVFALITHCCGVMEHWGGGRTSGAGRAVRGRAGGHHPGLRRAARHRGALPAPRARGPDR